MAHIPMDDTDTLWNETPDHSWSALAQTLSAHKGKTNGIADELVDLMMTAVKQMESTQASYPASSQELNRILNENLPQEGK